MSIQRRLYEQLAKLNQEKVIEDGPPHQNPLKTTFGGTKDAQKTDSMQRYYDKVKADQAARAVKTAAEREKERLANRESVDLDELKQSTLMSYKKKAQNDMNDIARANQSNRGPLVGKDRTDFRKRVKGIDGATRRLVARQYQPEDVEQVDELKSSTLRSYADKAATDNQNRVIRQIANDPAPTPKNSMDKLRSRSASVQAALSRLDARSRLRGNVDKTPEERKLTKRLAREDVEQIDELSPETLKSYIWKAKGKVQSDLNTDNHSPKTNKRAKNVVKAKGKLGEAIKFDAGHPDSGISGTVSGKGKRNRKAGGEVRVKYKGHPAYKDDSPGLPIKAREIGRLIRTARKKDTKPHDSKNLTNPTVTRDPNGAGVRGGGVRKVRTEGVGNIIKRAYGAAQNATSKFDKALDNKTKGFEKRVDDKLNKPAKTTLGKLGQQLFNSFEYTDEGMTAAQKRDRDDKDNATRETVAGVKVPSTDDERKRYATNWKSKNRGNTKARKLRDLMLKGKRNESSEIELDELVMPKKDARGNVKSGKVRSAFAKGADNAQGASNRAMDKALGSKGDRPEIDSTIDNIDKSIAADGRRDERNRKAGKKSVGEGIINRFAESEVDVKDLRYKRTKVSTADERARRDREAQSHERDKARSTTEELLSVVEDLMTEAKDSYEVVALKGKKVVAKMPTEQMDIKDAVAAMSKMHAGAEVQVHKNGKVIKTKG